MKKSMGVLGIVAAIIVLMVLSGYEVGEYPKLSEFGRKKWSVQCKGPDREYRLSSIAYKNSQRNYSISQRELSFLDQNNDIFYVTRVFDKSSLDKDGVWRFKYRKWDIRLSGKKDKTKVLKGDEKVFEIAEDFKSMVVITKNEQNLKLSCEQIQKPVIN